MLTFAGSSCVTTNIAAVVAVEIAEEGFVAAIGTNAAHVVGMYSGGPLYLRQTSIFISSILTPFDAAPSTVPFTVV